MIALPVPGQLKDQLAAEVSAIELERIPDGSGRARGADAAEGWLNGLSMARIEWTNYPILARAIRHLVVWRDRSSLPRSPAQVMVNLLDAGAALDRHRDGPPHDRERWHLPIITEPGVSWWDEDNGAVYMSTGAWWGPCPYWLLHSMHNRSTIDRLHVVCDLPVAGDGEIV